MAHTQSAYMLKNSICLLGHISSLTTFMLNMYQDTELSKYPISLAPLRGLRHLTALSLACGEFKDLDAAMHLTALKLDQCEATCAGDCSMVSSLVQLQILESDVNKFHENGVSACSILTSLACKEAFISAIDPLNTLYLGENAYFEASLPASLANITTLRDLALETACAELQLCWLNSLSCLQSICICINGGVIEFPSSLSRLTNL